jgi:UDP-N-acetylmuramoyl-tripeptide--D-alanyl-D-alanine ligase
MAEPLWTIAEAAGAAQAERGDAAAQPDTAIGGVSIDSRTLVPGDLFVAIKGERMDGHAYVPQALANGAAAALVERDYSGEGPLLRTDDTLEALNRLGRVSRARSSAQIIGITGSVGKTGTKEMLRLMLAGQAATHASEKSYNNQWGVPLSLARMPRETFFGIFEMGMNHAGEISVLTRMVRPHIALITTVAPVHAGFFNSVEDIADAKAEIFEGLEPGGHVVLPAENEHYARLAAHARRFGAAVTTFGSAADCDARLLRLEARSSGSQASADIMGEPVAFTLNAPGAHLVSNALAALAAVKLAGGDVQQAAKALAHFEPPDGRGKRLNIAMQGGHLLVIDETYNANPASMAAALQVLAQTGESGIARRIAVLGDMLELGRFSAQYHAELAAGIDFARVDLVFCCGPQMTHLYDQIPASHKGGYAPDSESLAGLVADELRAGDAVMVKGSLGSRMGRIVEVLKARHEVQGTGLDQSAA